MSKSLIIAIVATVLGLATIAVGLYVLSQTPAPAETATESPAPASSSAEPIVFVPQVDNQQTLTGEGDGSAAEPGSEPWCEALMVKPNQQWSDKDARLFADNCVYP